MPDFSKIPQTLKDCACWLVAKLVPQPTADNPGKIAKLPWDFAKDCKASGWQLQENLLPFPDAVALLESNAGPYVLGFAFKHSPFLGIDIDKAFDDRSLKKALEPVYREFCSGFYHEWSPSGRGIRAFVRRDGALPDWVNENRDAFSLYGGCQVEVFAGGFCTVTGKAFPNATDKVKVAAPLDVYGFCKSRAEADSLADEKGGRNSGVMSWAGLQAKKLAEIGQSESRGAAGRLRVLQVEGRGRQLGRRERRQEQRRDVLGRIAGQEARRQGDVGIVQRFGARLQRPPSGAAV